jgi:hypothetical protein
MRIAADVLEHARGLESSYESVVLAMSLEPAGPGDDLFERAVRAVSGLGGEDLFWSVESGPAGLVISQWGYTPDIARTLGDLADALAAAEVEGDLILHQRPAPPARSTLRERDEPLLECHVRFRGRREREIVEVDAQSRAWSHSDVSRRTLLRWVSDPEARVAGIEAGVAWLGCAPPGARYFSPAGSHPSVEEAIVDFVEPWREIHADPETGARFIASLRLRSPVWWETEEAFGLLEFDAQNLSVATGGTWLASGGWEAAYSALLAFLRASAGWGAYGLIKRGRRPEWVGRSLARDWLPAVHYGAGSLRHSVYEDVLAPDAFGAQLLGPGYRGRIPQSPE